jgi:hypothetical protein
MARRPNEFSDCALIEHDISDRATRALKAPRLRALGELAPQAIDATPKPDEQ